MSRIVSTLAKTAAAIALAAAAIFAVRRAAQAATPAGDLRADQVEGPDDPEQDHPGPAEERAVPLRSF